MNKQEFDSIILKYSFTKAADIARDNGLPKFTNLSFNDAKGYVYLWVEIDKDSLTIVYVGKAGKTLKERCAQHASGFKSSATGKKHAKRFEEGFQRGYRYALYARKSEFMCLLDEHEIPSECIEELVFIKKLSPTWNFG